MQTIILGCASIPEFSRESLEIFLSGKKNTFQCILDGEQQAYLERISGLAAPDWQASRYCGRLLAWQVKKEQILTGRRLLPIFVSGLKPCFAHAEKLVFCGWFNCGEASGIGLDAEKIFGEEQAASALNFLGKYLPFGFCSRQKKMSASTIARIWTVTEALYKYVDDEKIFFEIVDCAIMASLDKTACEFYWQDFHICIKSFFYADYWLTIIYSANFQPKIEWHFISWKTLAAIQA